MKYKTTYEENAWLYYLGLIIGIFSSTLIVGDLFSSNRDTIAEYVMYLTVAIIGFLGFGIYKYKQKCRIKIYKNGKKYSAKIVSAEEHVAKGGNIYYLKIEFIVDDVKKIITTDGYVGNPNYYLTSVYCSVYDLNDKYAEGDFRVCDKIRENQNIIRLYKFNPYKLRRKKK